MKTSRSIFIFSALILSGALAFSSCKKKDKEEEDNDTSLATDNSYVENLSNDIDNIGDQAGNSTSGSALSTYKLVIPDNSILSTCATISVFNADSANADTLLVDFGNTNCVCNDGKARNGQIRYVYSGGKHYRDSGLVVTSTPFNYTVDGNAVTGSKTIKNKGRISNGNFVWEIAASYNVVKANAGGTVQWSCNRTKTLLNTSAVYTDAASPINWPQAKIGITGSANGIGANGTSYSLTVTNQLIRDFTCSPSTQHPHRHPFIQGTFELTPSGKPVRTVDFGNGTCDLNATVTVNGHTYNFTL